jgi:hypothetical protein
MKTKSILTTLTFTVGLLGTAGISHAQTSGSGDDLNKIYQQIDEAETASENLRNQLQITFEEKNITFPDYANAFAEFLNTAQISLGGLKTTLDEIKKEVSDTLSDEYTRLRTTEKNDENEHSRESAALLKIQQDKFNQHFTALSVDINKKYQVALNVIFSLQGRVALPIKKGRVPIMVEI